MRPRICIPARDVTEVDWAPALCGVREDYFAAIVAAGGMPIVVPKFADQKLIAEYAEDCTGLLLTGGEDVDPARYGETPHRMLGQISPQRDQLEFAVLEQFWQRKRPIMAICRGMQVLNVALGGTLYQDIPSQISTTLSHKTDKGFERWTELSHDLRLEANCKLSVCLGTNLLKINSVHHQAIKGLAEKLIAVGWSEDGVVEAVEAKDAERFVVAVQCHPEMLWEQIDTRWQNVFRAFVKAAAETN